jgi:hypothetical protein
VEGVGEILFGHCGVLEIFFSFCGRAAIFECIAASYLSFSSFPILIYLFFVDSSSSFHRFGFEMKSPVVLFCL